MFKAYELKNYSTQFTEKLWSSFLDVDISDTSKSALDDILNWDLALWVAVKLIINEIIILNSNNLIW